MKRWLQLAVFIFAALSGFYGFFRVAPYHHIPIVSAAASAMIFGNECAGIGVPIRGTNGTDAFGVNHENACVAPSGHIVFIGIDSMTIAGGLTAGTINNTVYVTALTPGFDICAQIVNAAATLPAIGGIVDVTIPQGVQPACTSGTMVLGQAGQQILIKQGSSTIATNANPGLKIVDGAGVTWIGISSNASELLCTNTTASAPCVQWIGSRGGMERMWISTNQNTGIGMILDASLSTSGVRFNTFKDMRINVSTVNANTQNGVQLNAQDGTHLVSFNNFINDEIVGFSTCYSLTMQGGGSVGPTDNMFLGGQCRETTAGATGTGINIGQAAQNNWFFGGNISDFVTAINIAAFATTNQNKFYAVIMESNTNSVTIGAGSTDNAFIGCLLGVQTFTDNGTRTVLFGDGNNNFGPSGAGIQKQGAPWLNPTFISTGGTVATLNSAATGNQTITFPNNTGTVFGSTALSNAQVAAGTGGTPFFQLVRQTCAATDVILDMQNNSQSVWRIMCTGALRNFATAAPASGTAGATDYYTDSTANWPFFNPNNTGFVKMLAAGSGANNPLQTKRVSGCATGAAQFNTCDTTVNWTNTYADTNYTAHCTGDVVTSGVPQVEGINISAAKANGSITVRTIALTAVAAQFTTIDCTAIHD